MSVFKVQGVQVVFSVPHWRLLHCKLCMFLVFDVWNIDGLKFTDKKEDVLHRMAQLQYTEHHPFHIQSTCQLSMFFFSES